MKKNPNVSDQQSPIDSDSIPIWDLVKKDIDDRNQAGIKKYGMPLKAWNGRDSSIDAYQEALDLVVYHRQMIEERKEIGSFLSGLLIDSSIKQELREQAFNLLVKLNIFKGGEFCLKPISKNEK